MPSHAPQGASGQHSRACKDRTESSCQLTPWQCPQLSRGEAEGMPSTVRGRAWRSTAPVAREQIYTTAMLPSETWKKMQIPMLCSDLLHLYRQSRWVWDSNHRAHGRSATVKQEAHPGTHLCAKSASIWRQPGFPQVFLSVFLAYRHKYEFLHSGMTPDIRITVPPKRIGILLDYKNCKLSFFNADIAQHLYTFTSQFQHYVHPCFALETPGILRIHTGIATPPWTALP